MPLNIKQISPIYIKPVNIKLFTGFSFYRSLGLKSIGAFCGELGFKIRLFEVSA